MKIIPEKIKHQQQPTSNTCTSTCIAMLLDEPVEKIIEEFHEDYYSKAEIVPATYLKDKIKGFRKCYSSDSIFPNAVYLLRVPSLNLQATTHSILFDARYDDLVIYDPNKGKSGKYFYSWDDEELKNNPLARRMKGYSPELEFVGDDEIFPTKEQEERIEYVNGILHKQECIQRKEDMSPNGTMTLFVQPDGDMVVQIVDTESHKVSTAEFCMPYSGGGGSPKTHAALRDLFVAMVEDQAAGPHSRDGRFPVRK